MLKRLAMQKESEAAVLFSSGYQANLGLIQALSQCGFTFYVDRLAHASIWDGLAMAKAKFHRFRHNDTEHLNDLLHNKLNELNIIVTEGIFSMDGDHSPVQSLSDIAKHHNSLLWIDEAHSDGIMGPNGEGILSTLSREKFHIQTLTFGKAYGTHGAAICAASTITQLIWQFARSWIYSTSPGPWWAGSINSALNIAKKESWRREKALQNTSLLQTELINNSFIQERNLSCITPIIIGKSDDTRFAQNFLKKCGLWIPAIRPPTVPIDTARLRVNTCAFHQQNDIELFINKMIELRDQHANIFIK